MRNVRGREQLSPRPCHLGRPVIGGRAITWPRGWGGRKRAPFQGEAEAAEVRIAPRSVSASDPRRQFGRSLHLSAVNGGGMEHEGSGGSGGSAGLLQQILSLKLVPRVGNGTLCPNSTSLCSFPGTGPAPCRACALCVLASPPGRGAPLPQRASERAGGFCAPRCHLPGLFPSWKEVPALSAGSWGIWPFHRRFLAGTSGQSLRPRAGGQSGQWDWSVEGVRRPLGLILLLQFPDAPGSDWDSKEPRKRSPLLVWGARRLAPAVRRAARLSAAPAARTPNRPRRAEGPNAALRLRRGLVSPGPPHPQVVCGSLAPASKCAHSASFSPRNHFLRPVAEFPTHAFKLFDTDS